MAFSPHPYCSVLTWFKSKMWKTDKWGQVPNQQRFTSGSMKNLSLTCSTNWTLTAVQSSYKEPGLQTARPQSAGRMWSALSDRVLTSCRWPGVCSVFIWGKRRSSIENTQTCKRHWDSAETLTFGTLTSNNNLQHDRMETELWWMRRFLTEHKVFLDHLAQQVWGAQLMA